MASAKVDSRGSFGSKRSRNDAPRNDGDWTCPQCGNVNYGFRTVCNRGKCGAARPNTPVAAQRMGSVPPSGPFSHSPYYLGGGVAPPPPVPQVMPSSYGPPFSVHGMRYDYGAPATAPLPYGLLSPYSGSFGGMAYGGRAAVAGYGFGVQGSPLPTPGQWSGDVPDNNASRKRRGGPNGLAQGDWICPKCDNINFAFRTTCNMKKCATPRPSSGPQSCSGAPDGSWTCTKCENINYPFRTVCNRKGCGSEKPASGN